MRKKLIEVALPLEAINAASAREKSIRHGHPSTLHLWWARRPLAAARAVLFAQLVDDPSSWPELFPTEEAQNQERQRLFQLIEKLVVWENSNDDAVVNAARLEIARSHARSALSPRARAVLAETVQPDVIDRYLAEELPPVHDPFAGGGTIPLEAQRLGLRAIASDLNPVAVLINKALIELPSLFIGRRPVNPTVQNEADLGEWKGARGLAADVRHYGAWVGEEAKRRIGALYKDVELPSTHGSGKPASVIAWLWARTVESPDPAFKGCQVPLISTYYLCAKEKKQVWLRPHVTKRTYSFEIVEGAPKDEEVVRAGTKLGRGSQFRCILSGAPISTEHVRTEARAGRLGQVLLAVVADGPRGRVYLPATAQPAAPASDFLAEMAATEISGYLNPPLYGLTTIGSFFSPRQRFALETIAGLAKEARDRCVADGASEDYATAVATYLALATGRLANRLSSLCIWNTVGEKIEQTFSEQGVGMTWDFAEANPFSGATGSWEGSLEWIPKVLEQLRPAKGSAHLVDAASCDLVANQPAIVSTDPPYFSSITYADFADFFYGLFRHSLRDYYRELFATVASPKDEEAVAAWHRFGGNRGAAAEHFTQKIGESFAAIRRRSSADVPITVYYAFKEQEFAGKAGATTAWESILNVVLERGLSVVCTWPIRTERTTGRKARKNSLATSIVLVCRPASPSAPTISGGEFRRKLRAELPRAIHQLQAANLAPVDLVQACIGPGMAVYSEFSAVVEADGARMSVRSALKLIGEVRDEFLASGEGDFDASSRFALTWYEQYGWEPGPFGVADTLARAQNVHVEAVKNAGICAATSASVRILRRSEMRPLDYDPRADKTPTVWEFTQHMIRYLEEDGEEAAARLLKRLGSAGDATRELAYRLFNTCERKKWAEDARSYNALILAWPELEKLAAKLGDDEPPPPAPSAPSKKPKRGAKKAAAKKKSKQGELFAGDEE